MPSFLTKQKDPGGGEGGRRGGGGGGRGCEQAKAISGHRFDGVPVARTRKSPPRRKRPREV